MKILPKLALGGLAVAVLAAAYWYLPFEGAGELEFRPRKFPPGMRELVLDQGISAFNTALTPRQLERITERARPNSAQVCRMLFRDVSSPSSGATDSPVQIVTFLDYRCPYCKTLSNIIDAMPRENVRVIYREWPILGEGSMLSARAALAADRQGKYLPFHKRLMNTRLIPTPGLIDSIATDLGLDIERLHADMAGEPTAQAIRQTEALAMIFGFSGTPALVVGRTVVQGEITRRQLEKLIADERSQAPQKDC
jgi:protein-disulfide isomerase